MPNDIKYNPYVSRKKLVINLQLILIVLLFFSGANLLKSIIPLILDVIFAVLFLGILTWGRMKRRRVNSLSFIMPALIFIYFIIVYASTIGVGFYAWSELLKSIMGLIFIYIIFFYFDDLTFDKFPRLYSLFIYYSSLLAILSLLMLIYSGIKPLYTFHGVDRSYENYFGTWIIVMGDYYPTVLDFNNFKIFRLQAWYEEPGTYAFLIIPASIYFFLNGNIIKCSVLILALFLTFSVGAWVAAILIYTFHLGLKRFLGLIIILFSIYFLASFTPLWDGVIKIQDGIIRYVQIKFALNDFSSDGHSYKYRLDLVSAINLYFSTTPVLGTGLSYSEYFENIGMNSRSIFTRLVAGGIMGSFVLISIYVYFIFITFITIRQNRSKDNILYSTFLLTFIFMGFQRASFLDGYMYLFIVIASSIYCTKLTSKERLKNVSLST